MFNLADIQAIRNAIENDTLTVFVGAGFSKFAETDTIKFPSWEELMTSFRQDLDISEDEYLRMGALKLAQLYYNDFKEYRLYEKLRSIIPSHANPSPLHEQLFDLKPKYVITTNFDNLLEKTINEQGLIYDIIKSDDDFVKSTLPKKLIKIHGDLDTHNIVFKEDDYLNYANNRPLLDNFLRHILSSTTVLFLGYSYGDNNVKQITKWIEKQSKISPPRFMLKPEENKSEIKYLDNHHIRVICPNTNNKLDFKSLYESFFQSILLEKFNLIQNIDLNDDALVIDYFYNQLKGLAELNVLLPKQIQSLFTNCTIEYHNGYFGLWFHQETMTMDYNINIRRINIRFIEILEDIKDNNIKDSAIIDKCLSILKLFIKADIIYLKYENNKYINTYYIAYSIINKRIKYIIFNNCNSYIFINDRLHYGQKSIIHIVNYYLNLKMIEENYNNFIEFSENMSNLLFKNMILFGNFKEKKSILHDIQKIISKNKREKKFLQTMICQFNYRYFCYNILNDIKIDNDDKNEIRKIIKNIDDEMLIENYPKKYRKHLRFLYDFVDFKDVYKLSFYTLIDNRQNINNAKTFKNGGFGFYDKEHRLEAYSLMILKFVSGNEVLMDNYTEFKNFMCSYMTGKIEIQHIREKFEFKNHELFILIKYFNLNDLLDLISTQVLPFVKDEKQAGLGENIIHFSDEQKKYLKDTFNNLLVLFQKYSHSFYSNTISNSFINLLLVISLVKWNDDELKEIIAKVNQAFVGGNYPYDFIKSIDRFVLINYKLYKTQNNSFFEFIDTILSKLIQGKLRELVVGNVKDELSHIYGYASSEKYANLEMVEKAIKYLQVNFLNDNKNQRYFAKLFLANLINISADKIKKQISDFIKEIKIQDWNNVDFKQYDEIFTELDFLQYGIELDESFISFLGKWIEQLDDSIITDLELLKQGGIDQMLHYFEFLIKHKNLTKFEPLMKKLKEKSKEIYNSPE